MSQIVANAHTLYSMHYVTTLKSQRLEQIPKIEKRKSGNWMEKLNFYNYCMASTSNWTEVRVGVRSNVSVVNLCVCVIVLNENRLQFVLNNIGNDWQNEPSRQREQLKTQSSLSMVMAMWAKVLSVISKSTKQYINGRTD